MNRFNTISILALAVCVLQSGWLHAATDEEIRTRAVSYTDLNLSRPADMAVLRERIDRAAVYVCGPYNTGDLSRLARFKHCRVDAMNRALAQVRLTRLTSTQVEPLSR